MSRTRTAHSRRCRAFCARRARARWTYPRTASSAGRIHVRPPHLLAHDMTDAFTTRRLPLPELLTAVPSASALAFPTLHPRKALLCCRFPSHPLATPIHPNPTTAVFYSRIPLCFSPDNPPFRTRASIESRWFIAPHRLRRGLPIMRGQFEESSDDKSTSRRYMEPSVGDLRGTPALL